MLWDALGCLGLQHRTSQVMLNKADIVCFHGVPKSCKAVAAIEQVFGAGDDYYHVLGKWCRSVAEEHDGRNLFRIFLHKTLRRCRDEGHR